MDYCLLERKDLNDDSLIVVPSNLRHRNIDKLYNKAGEFTNINDNDFRHHEHWCFDYLPLVSVGSIAEQPSLDAGIEALCNAQPTLDRAMLAADKQLAEHMLAYETLTGKIYVARFNGIHRIDKTAEVYSVAFFTDPKNEAITVDDQVLRQGSQKVKTELDVIMPFYTGKLEVVEVGTAKIHRKSLRPYESTGKYGSIHRNGPWIVLTKQRSAL